MNSLRIVFLFAAFVLCASFAQAQDSLNVSRLGQLTYWNTCYDIAVVGDYAYCAVTYSGLRIVNISDLPLLPKWATVARSMRRVWPYRATTRT